MFLPPLSFTVYCFFLASLQSIGLPTFPYSFMAFLAVAFSIIETALNLPNTFPVHASVLFHKYIAIRFMLEAADGIAAHRPGGCLMAIVHNACRLWALSWRWLRDYFLGLFLTLFCISLSS